MQTTTRPTDAQTQTEYTARVAVRVPRDGTENLTGSARHRLETPTGVDGVDVETLCGLEPALAATVAQLEVQVTTTEPLAEATVEELLADAPGTERVERVTARG